MVKETGSDLGIAVDPDVDRLVLICEDGSFFNEENTIVAVTKHILENHDNLNVVTNLSTTTAVKELVNENNGNHFESAVGETNVVEMMKLKRSILGGEGSGGVIFKPSHYGRDALVAICLILSHLAIKKISLKELLRTLPKYFMIKDKIIFDEKNNNKIQKYIDKKVEFCKQNKIKFSEIDGLKIWFDDKTWVHIRKSNTEPLLRLIVESFSSENAKKIKQLIVKEITFFNMKNIYLDNAATTEIDAEVIDVMVKTMRGNFGNPSSIHSEGRKTRSLIEESRKKIADLLNSSPSEIFFTSGGTEADNMAIRGAVRDAGVRHIITSKIEHAAVINTVANLENKKKVTTSFVKLNEDGEIDLENLEYLLSITPMYWLA